MTTLLANCPFVLTYLLAVLCFLGAAAAGICRARTWVLAFLLIGGTSQAIAAHIIGITVMVEKVPVSPPAISAPVSK